MPDYNLGTAHGLIDIDTSGIDAAGRKLTSAGRQMIGFGTALTAGFVTAVKTSADFEKEMSTISAVTAAGAEEIDRLRQAALDMGSKGPFGPTEVAQAFVELAKAGLSAQEIIEGAGTATINLAKAGDLPIARAAEIAANAMRTFGIEAKDVNDVVDNLAGAANQSTLDVDDLAVSMRYTGGVAAALKIPIEQVNTALALLGNAGIKGSTGGTSLRRILLQLSPDSKEARKELQNLGIITEDGANQFFNAAGEAKDLNSVFQILRDATKDLTDEQKVNSINTIFGARASAAALILMEQAGQGFVDMNAEISKTSAADVAAERLDNLSGSMRRLKAAVQAYLIDAGGPFQQTLKKIVDSIIPFINALAASDSKLGQWILLATLAAGALLLFMGAFSLVAGTILRFITSVKALVAGLGLLINGVGAVITFFTTTLIGGILLVIIAIIALGVALYLLYKHNEGFHKFVDKLWQVTQKAWDKILVVFYAVARAAVVVGKALVDAWNASFPVMKKTVQVMWEVIQVIWQVLQAVWGGLVVAAQFIAEAAQKIGKAVTDTIDFFRDLPGNIAKYLGIAYRAVVNFFVSLPGLAVQGLALLGQAFMQGLAKLPYLLGFAIGFLIGVWLRFEIWWYTTLIKFMIDLVQLFWDGLQKLVPILLQVTGWLIEHAVKFALEFPGMLLGFLDTLLDLFVKGMVALVTFLVSWIGDMIGKALSFSIDFAAATIKELPKLPGQLSGIFLDMLNAFIRFVGDILMWAAGFSLDLFRAIWDAFKDLPQTIINAIKSTVDIANFLFDIGRDIIQGLINGIKSMAGIVKDTVGDVVSGIKDGFKSGFGLFSPSKVTTDYGKMIGQGLVNGVKSEQHNMIKLIDSLQKDMEQLTTVQRSLSSSPGVGSLLPVTNTGIQPVNVQAGNTINTQIYNPSAQTAEESMFLTAQKLQYLGVF